MDKDYSECSIELISFKNCRLGVEMCGSQTRDRTSAL
jgi:hypothetical protein